MKIVAALAFYHEPPTFLYRCVKSLGTLVDQLVAYDGAWEMFPDGTAESTREEWDAINRAACEVELPYTIYAPDTVWGSQVEKRAALMAEAGENGDWLFVIDGDEYVWSAKPGALEYALSRTEMDVATVMLENVTGHEGSRGKQPIRRLYRASCGITVDTAHNGYRTADGRWLHGDGAAVRLESPLDCSGFLHLYHEKSNRGEDRNRRALAYRAERMRLRTENWRERLAS
jgi:hypothetical protein